MIIGICPLLFVIPPGAGFTAMNCVRLLEPILPGFTPMMVLGVAKMGTLAALVVVMIWGERTLPAVAKEVGMYVMGRMVGHD